MSRIIDQLADISADYDALFCDVWGVVHDGITPGAEAVAALMAYRAQGGAVILVTNSPQPRAGVKAQLDRIGVPRDAWDSIATSGDSARAAMFLGAVGSRVLHLGEGKDQGFFEDMALIDNPVTITRVESVTEAEGIICTGPNDPHQGPEQHEVVLRHAKQLGLKLLCANPDIVVDRGETREFCAGAVAKFYTEIGGESLYFGKPHPPIYDLASRRLASLGRDVARGRILAVGDGIATDVAGGMAEGLDTLFVAGGLARGEVRRDGKLSPEALDAFLANHQLSATYSIDSLR